MGKICSLISCVPAVGFELRVTLSAIVKLDGVIMISIFTGRHKFCHDGKSPDERSGLPSYAIPPTIPSSVAFLITEILLKMCRDGFASFKVQCLARRSRSLLQIKVSGGVKESGFTVMIIINVHRGSL